MKTNQDRTRRLSVLSWVLYGLATVLLIASILLGLSVSGASAAVPAAAIGFQSPAFKPVWDVMVSGLQLLGLLVFAGGSVLAVLLLSVGMLLGHIVCLERRLNALEDALISHAHFATLPDRTKTVLPAQVEPHRAV
ncbi:MAG: hypothetical protein R6W76_21620 [Caldilinea sp.]|jgi:hypothetical protein